MKKEHPDTCTCDNCKNTKDSQRPKGCCGGNCCNHEKKDS